MTAAVAAQTQSTAPVVEFNCLYTRDIRRKQKRWNDGFLRYHTFNKRVMVYDVPRNFIGDAHWKSAEALQDGDEVTLEEQGVMVQVAESIGTTQTDLTGLRNSRKKVPSGIASSPALRPAPATIKGPSASEPRPITQSKHRSLGALLGTPKAPLGRAALPLKSPFDERQVDVENQDILESRSAKRKRTDSDAWTVTAATKAVARSEPPLRARTADPTKRSRKQAPLQCGQRRLGNKEVVDLCEDDHETRADQFLAGFSSDALVPPSSPQRPASLVKSNTVRSSSPAFQAQNSSAGAELRRKASANRPGRQSDAAGQRETLTSHADHDFDLHTVDSMDVSHDPNPSRAPDASPRLTTIATKKPTRSLSSEPPRMLRMSASTHRKKSLLCQDQLSLKTLRSHSANAGGAARMWPRETPQEAISIANRNESQQNKLQQRLARISEKERESREHGHVGDALRWDVPVDKFDVDVSFSLGTETHQERSPEQRANGVAELDQMLLSTELPRVANISTTTFSRLREPRTLRRVVSESGGPILDRSRRPIEAGIGITPSPSKSISTSQAPSRDVHTVISQSRDQPARHPRPRGQKLLQRTTSLNVAAKGTSTVILSRPFRSPKASNSAPTLPPREPEPWSREAFDLFTWRPPNWDEEEWCMKTSNEMAVVDGQES